MGGIIKRQDAPPQITDFKKGMMIGSGGFGIIYEVCRKKDHRWFALKSYNLQKMTLSEAQTIRTEVALMKQLPSHPFIVQMHAIFRERNSVSLVLDLFTGGDLRVSLRLGTTFTEDKVAYIIACIGSALHHLHLNRIIHRDVKPENIMFTSQGVPKLIDFGISYQAPSSSYNICICDRRSGTRPYLAPELFVSPNHYHGYESDFWSLGVIMYELLFHKRPYENYLPREMIAYTKAAYESSWDDLSQRTSVLTQTLRNESLSTTTITMSPNPTPKVPQAQQSKHDFLYFKSLGCSQSELLLLPSVDVPFTEDLIVPIPIHSHQQQPISTQCNNLLSRLLDVRIHERLGAIHNYCDFVGHEFFSSQGLSFQSLAVSDSPIEVNANLVADHVWSLHFAAHMGDDNTREQEDADGTNLPQEINEFVHELLSSFS